MCRKISALSTCPGEIKGQFHDKIEWDVILWLRKNKIQIYFKANLAKRIHSAH
jgi:hypothetical protein